MDAQKGRFWDLAGRGVKIVVQTCGDGGQRTVGTRKALHVGAGRGVRVW
jgi:hypothetical protein